MGITGLSGWLRDTVPAAFLKTNLETYRGHRLAIDTSIWVYQFNQRGHRASVEGIVVNELKRYSSLMESILRMLGDCLNAGVTPIFVLDGVSPPEKTATRERRKAAKAVNKAAVVALQAKWDATPVLDRTNQQKQALHDALVKNVELPRDIFRYIGDVLRQLGFPIFQAAGESDGLCAALAREGVVAGVISTDSDLLLYGVPRLINAWGPGYTKNERGLYIDIEVIDTAIVLQGLGLTLPQFIDMGIACGTDFNRGLAGYAMAKSHKKLIEGYCLPAVLNDEPLDKWRAFFAYRPHTQLVTGDYIYDIDTIAFRNGYNTAMATACVDPRKFQWWSRVSVVSSPTTTISVPIVTQHENH